MPLAVALERLVLGIALVRARDAGLLGQRLVEKHGSTASRADGESEAVRWNYGCTSKHIFNRSSAPGSRTPARLCSLSASYCRYLHLCIMSFAATDYCIERKI